MPIISVHFYITVIVGNIGETMAVAVQPTEERTKQKKPTTRQRRVVVTGMSVVSPLGHDSDVFYNNLLEGVSGISEIEAFDCTQFPTVNNLLNLPSIVVFSILCS